MARKHCLWRRLKADPNRSTLRDQYSKAESRCRLLVRNYEIRKENDVIKSNNLGKFYRFVNGRLANKCGIGILKDENGIPVTDAVKRAELLNNYFCSVCTQDDGTAPEFKCNKLTAGTSIDNVTFSETSIKRAIAKLKPNLASGMDGLPPLLVKKLSSSLLEPLTLLYTSFLSVGRIPDEWRRAVVMPIHKSGPADDVSNYRPIALTCVFSKIMERVVASAISGYMFKHGLISKQQHGFLAKRSTSTNLVESLNDWTLAVNNRQVVSVAYIDYKKAFDSVCHSKLFIKLNAYGITGSLLLWLKDFLHNRSQVTRVGDVYSSENCLVSGIVQGSCLGPLLFMIYINDVTDALGSDCTCQLFADDLKLYSVASIASNNTLVIQDSLDKLCQWSDLWQLTISHKKCSVMSIGCHVNDDCFKLEGQTVQSVNTVRDLGVHFCSNLTFTSHINAIVAKAHARASLIHKCFLSRDVSTLTKAFVTYVRPILEYATVIWSPYHIGEIAKLESVQRRFTKRLVGLRYMTYSDRINFLELDSLEERRLRFDLMFAYKILFGLVNVNWCNMFSFNVRTATRGHSYKLYAETSRVNVRHNFFCNRVVNVWNRLPASDCHFKTFKTFKSFLTTQTLTALLY